MLENRKKCSNEEGNKRGVRGKGRKGKKKREAQERFISGRNRMHPRVECGCSSTDHRCLCLLLFRSYKVSKGTKLIFDKRTQEECPCNLATVDVLKRTWEGRFHLGKS